MKITHHWLQEFVPLAGSVAELAAELTLAGLEVESLSAAAPLFSGVVVGEVLNVSRHPNAEKLSVCEVTTDGVDRQQIICGASNVRAGLKVAVARQGARLPGEVLIKRAKLRGLESNGMLCSARELGLGDEHEGILELPSSAPIGGDLRDTLDLDDTTLEINATPNRGDCMSVFGIARDYAATHDHRHLVYEGKPVASRHDTIYPASITAGSACPVFATRVIRGVGSRLESPAWLRERLRRVGIGSISPIVDVTNYVMIELGQPLHAYDLARIRGPITVRMARPAERLMLLDDKDHGLDEDMLVIADERGAIGAAGIMGGRATAISGDTTDVMLEAAHFTPDAIAGRARRLGLFTDAAQRFERGVDPTLPIRALERATELLLSFAAGEPGPVSLAAADPLPSLPRAEWVTLRRCRLHGLLGVSVPDDEVYALLQAVTGQVERLPDGWRARQPPHRFDIAIEADLIEEVARLRGFDSIPESPAMTPQLAGYAAEARVDPDRLLTAMTDAGYQEVITYSFVDPGLQRQLFPETPALALANAISLDLSEMRVSLWPGLVRSAQENLRRQQSRLRLFEMGTKFDLSTGELREVQTLAGLAAGARFPEQWGVPRETADFYDMKADLMKVLAMTGCLEDFHFDASSCSCLRPGRTARIYRLGEPVGWLGELHPRLTKSLAMPTNTLLFELEMLSALIVKSPYHKEISKFPSVRRDLAVVLDDDVPLAKLRENVTVAARGLIRELRVFDVYKGPGIDSGRKSIALGLILQDSSRTLTDVDADAVVASVVARLRDELSATIRDQ